MKQTVRDLHNYMNNKSSNKYHALVTSSFSKTKGFFCFSLNKRSPKDTLGKLSFPAYVTSRKQSANQQKQPCHHASHAKTSQSAKN